MMIKTDIWLRQIRDAGLSKAGDYNAPGRKSLTPGKISATTLQQITGIEYMLTGRFPRDLGRTGLKGPVNSFMLSSDTIRVTPQPCQGPRQHTVDRIEIAAVKQLTE